MELEYNFTARLPLKMLPHVGYTYNQDNYPCVFLGSPIIPHHFIMSNVYYPQSEGDNKAGGEVVLMIKVSSRGLMTDYYIKSSTNDVFAKIVAEAAELMPRNKWRWIPARKDGKDVDGEYRITIVFENE